MTLHVHFYRAVIRRETLKLLAQKDRLASALVRPLLWLWIIGGGMQALAGPDYAARLLPGIVGMSLLFGGMVGGLSIAFDKDAGTMRLLVTSPVHPLHVIVAKALAATVAALVQASLLLAVLLLCELLAWGGQALAWPVQEVFTWTGHWSWPNPVVFAVALVLGGFCCACLGVAVGVTAKSLDNYAVMMNFVIFPLFFLSGALYPVAPMPALAKWVASVNPFTYCVDLLRSSFGSSALGASAEFSLGNSIAWLTLSAVMLLLYSAWQFSRSGTAMPLRT